jgi:hypothetical protein
LAPQTAQAGPSRGVPRLCEGRLPIPLNGSIHTPGATPERKDGPARMANTTVKSDQEVVGTTKPAAKGALGDFLLRWAVRGSFAGFGVSLIVHIALLLVAAVWHLGGAQAGGGSDRGLGGEIAMAIMSEGELGAIEESALDVTTPSVGEVAMETLPSVEIIDGPGGAGEAPGADGIGGLSEGVTGAGGDIGDSIGAGDAGSGTGGAAKFFGVEAVGTRFAYIVDVSGSMQGTKLRSLKIELIESLGALPEQTQFFVAFYSTEANPMGGRTRWTRSDASGKEWAKDRTNEITAFGGTNPLPGFQIVFDLLPRPDAVYFMTDGLFDAEVAGEVAKMNKRGKRVPIHTIGFDMQDPAAETLLKRIAEESGGRYSPVGIPGDQK